MIEEVDSKKSAMRLGLIALVGLLIGLGAGAFIFMSGNRSSGATSAANVSANNTDLGVGAVAPDFTTINLATGEEITLSELQGRPVMLNFWATWCGPCRIEMPHMQAAFEEHADDGLVILAVNNRETAEQISPFVEELGLTFDVGLDETAEIQNQYRIRAYPSSYFIDADGKIASFHLGVLTEGQLAEQLDFILP